MSLAEREQQFKVTIEKLPQTRSNTRIAENFGWSNSSRVIEGGLFACTNNLEAYSANVTAGKRSSVEQFIFLCVLTFPPQEEVYFAVFITSDADKINGGLIKLFREGEERNRQLTAQGKKQ